MSFESLSLLRQKYCCPMNFGVAMDSDKLRNTNFVKIIPYVFDSITCENNMKPNAMTTNNQVSYNYTNADAVVNFAKKHNMTVLGHVLWYDPENNPSYVRRTVTSANMITILQNHITNVITHFNTTAPNTVYAWHVTNESLTTGGNMQTDQIIQQILGNNSFTNLYQYANNTLTSINKRNIKLFYNDFQNINTNGIFNTLKALKDAGLLHGIGLQCHQGILSDTVVEDITKKYIQEGFEVHYTEIDYAISTVNENNKQPLYFSNLIKIALKYGVRNFTVWGLTDDTSWKKIDNGRTQYPLLFDSNYQPKNCYNALIQELKIFGSQIYDVFIIAGQSNSCGRGVVEYTFDVSGGGIYDMRKKSFYHEDFNNTFNDNIREFSYDNRIVPAFERLDTQEDPRPTPNTYGFGVSFARQYIKERKLVNGRKILLIHCGVGGTGFFSNAGRGIWDMNSNSGGNLYKGALKKIQIALNAINPSSQVKGILWHQGEGDIAEIFGTKEAPTSSAIRISKSATYTSMLISMLNSLRTIIGFQSVPAPILLGGMSPSYYIKHAIGNNSRGHLVNVDIKDTTARYMSNLISKIALDNSASHYKFVSAEPITTVADFNHYLKGDPITHFYHFNKSSEIEYGKRYFYIFNNNQITLT